MKESSGRQGSDTVNPILRYDRDNFFDQTIGSPEPLRPETAKKSHMSEGAVYGVPPEIPPLSPESVIMIGRFRVYHSVLSASHRSVYTEVRIDIQQVIKEGLDEHISPATDITVAVPGGTVRLEDGRTMSYLTDDRQYSIQSNHTYLLLLTHQHLGDFFVIQKSWDVTDGVVRPNSVFEVERASKGQSHLAGLAINAAVSELKNIAVQSR